MSPWTPNSAVLAIRHLSTVSSRAWAVALLGAGLLLVATGPAAALPVPERIARMVAHNTIREHIATFGAWGGVSNPRIDAVEPVDLGGDRLAFNVRVLPSGHVLVAADDEFNPVLLYSDTHAFDVANAADPDSFEGWIVPEVGHVFARLREWARQRQPGTRPGDWARTSVARAWDHLAVEESSFRPLRKDFSGGPAPSLAEAGQPVATAGVAGTAIGPLLTTNWAQGSRYNDYAPAGPTCAHTLSGCVAIATAQIMKYWNWPATGTGSHSYSWNGQTLTASFAHTYGWSLMPATLSGATASQVDAVARLVFDVGVAVEMDYGCDGSGAYTSWIATTVLPTYFSYKPTTGAINRSNHAPADFFVHMQGELNASPRRPILFTVRTLDGISGHALIIDGYQTGSADLVHLNLGWGASYQGWYNINADWSAGGYQWSASSQAIYPGIEPAAPHVTLSVVRNGTGAGTVTSTPAGVDCGSTCSAAMDEGATVTLSAAASAGSRFVAWSGDCSAGGSVTLTADRSCTATFDLVPPPVSTLTVARAGNGAGTVSSAPAGIACGSDCAETVANGTVMTLTATPAAGSIFLGWSGACTGMTSCAVTVSAATSVSAIFQATPIYRRYFAEGAVSGFFDCWFALLNTGPGTAHVTMRFLRDGASGNVTYMLDVPGGTRRTVDAKQVPGLYPSGGFSTIVESDVPVVADRTMSWDASGYGAHAETSVAGPAPTWYLAEGSTVQYGRDGPFNLYYLVQNPNDRAVTVEVRYLRPAPNPPITKRYTIGAQRRLTIWVNAEDPGLASTDVSGIVSSLDPAAPIIVERAMYLDAQGKAFGAGHDAAGVTSPSTDWFLAEGATGPVFDMYVLLTNPDTVAAELDVTYLLPDGRTVPAHYQVAANSRRTIWVNGEQAGGVSLANTSVSSRVHSTNGVPVIVERAMWWPRSGWYEAHCSAGTTETGTMWALAEGEQGGPRSVQTYILVANTSGYAGRVRVTLVFEDGSHAPADVDVPANSRTTVWTGGTGPTLATPFGGLTGGRKFGAVIESLTVNGQVANVVVERAMYWDAGGTWWAAGTNAGGTKLR